MSQLSSRYQEAVIGDVIKNKPIEVLRKIVLSSREMSCAFEDFMRDITTELDNFDIRFNCKGNRIRSYRVWDRKIQPFLWIGTFVKKLIIYSNASYLSDFLDSIAKNSYLDEFSFRPQDIDEVSAGAKLLRNPAVNVRSIRTNAKLFCGLNPYSAEADNQEMAIRDFENVFVEVEDAFYLREMLLRKSFDAKEIELSITLNELTEFISEANSVFEETKVQFEKTRTLSLVFNLEPRDPEFDTTMDQLDNLIQILAKIVPGVEAVNVTLKAGNRQTQVIAIGEMETLYLKMVDEMRKMPEHIAVKIFYNRSEDVELDEDLWDEEFEHATHSLPDAFELADNSDESCDVVHFCNTENQITANKEVSFKLSYHRYYYDEEAYQQILDDNFDFDYEDLYDEEEEFDEDYGDDPDFPFF